jgi:SAM-dependent methyltransferase
MTDRGGGWTGLAPGEAPFREAAGFYAEHRYRPSETFVGLLAKLAGWSTEDRVLDLGAGPAHLSLRLAPLVGEVVVMDPEPAMLEEGRDQAATAGVRNLSFVQGGSDDLPRRAAELSGLAGVTISQAFHWMVGQDAVLRALDPLVDRERGAVAIVGYVKDPDYNRLLVDRPPWDEVERILQRHLAGVPERPHPAGRHDPFPEILARSPFPEVELLTHEYELTVEPSLEAAIGFHYSLAHVLARLGERRAAFEAEARAALAGVDTSPFTVQVVDSALLGRRAT